MVTAQLIRYASSQQLAKLLDCHYSVVSRALSEHEYYDLVLRKAISVGVQKDVVEKGLRHRIRDYRTKRNMQLQFDELLKNKAA